MQIITFEYRYNISLANLFSFRPRKFAVNLSDAHINIFGETTVGGGGGVDGISYLKVLRAKNRFAVYTRKIFNI